MAALIALAPVAFPEFFAGVRACVVAQSARPGEVIAALSTYQLDPTAMAFLLISLGACAAIRMREHPHGEWRCLTAGECLETPAQACCDRVPSRIAQRREALPDERPRHVLVIADAFPPSAAAAALPAAQIAR